MLADRFFDTNVLLYLVLPEAGKTERATELLDSGGIISVQVLNEFTASARRKLKLEWQVIDEFIAAIRLNCKVVSLTEETWEQGRYIAERYQLQVYDAMIVSAALQVGAQTLYSEDLHAGLLIEGRLKVINPFAQTGR
ncbi:MAG: PIN domain-containing protein [Pseudoxanthomonas sp.]